MKEKLLSYIRNNKDLYRSLLHFKVIELCELFFSGDTGGNRIPIMRYPSSGKYRRDVRVRTILACNSKTSDLIGSSFALVSLFLALRCL